MLVDMDGEVLFQSGCLATSITYNRVDQMTLGKFLEQEVPKLRKDCRDLHVIRNSAAGSYTFILGDQVIKYHTTNVREARVRDMIVHMQEVEDTCKKKIEYPGIPYVVVCRINSPENTQYTISVPGRKRFYKYNTLAPGEPLSEDDENGFSIPYYAPPMWFTVALTKAHVMTTVKAAIVLSENPFDCVKSEIAHWPFANVHPDGTVCFGSSRFTTQLDGELADGKALMQAVELFFNQNHNRDLRAIVDNANSLYEGIRAAEREYYDALLQRCGTEKDTNLVKCLAVMREPEGWRKLCFIPISTGQFVRVIQ